MNHAVRIRRHPRALLISRTEAFGDEADSTTLPSHHNVHRTRHIATILGNFGYIVDVVDRRGVPSIRRCYDLVMSDRADLDLSSGPLAATPTKILLTTSLRYDAHNVSWRKRYDQLAERRGRTLNQRRVYPQKMPLLDHANAIIAIGNAQVAATWKECFGGPVYSFNNYGYQETEFRTGEKDYQLARTHFLFFAGGGPVHKGLDLLLEIFPRHRDLDLYVCGPYEREQDFCACYRDELYRTPNIHALGWLEINSRRFHELVRTCGWAIHPSCSDGQAASVVQCMMAGLVPLVTAETGIDTDGFGTTFADDSLDEIERTVLDAARIPAAVLRERSLKTRAVAEANYSESAFVDRWSAILSEILGRQPQRVSSPTGPKA